jgi:hypothetical protein
MVTDWLRRKQKAHDNKKSMEAYELRKQLALSMKWDLVRKKRAELQEKHQTLVDHIARVTEFLHLTLRHLSVKKFSTNVRAGIEKRIKKIHSNFLIGMFIKKVGRWMKRLKPTLL